MNLNIEIKYCKSQTNEELIIYYLSKSNEYSRPLIKHSIANMKVKKYN